MVATTLLALAVLAPGRPVPAHAPHDDIFAVVVSPAVGSDGVVHALSRGFLMRSTDTGETWRRVVQGLSNRSPLVALAGDPTDPALLYAASEDGAVLRSSDGGTGWERAGALPEEVAVTGLVVAPATAAGSPAPVLASSAEAGLLRSADGGSTWRPALDAPVVAVASGAATAQVWAIDHAGVLHTSDDAGATWRSEQVVDGSSHPTSLLVVPGDGPPVLLVGTDGGGVVRIDEQGAADRLAGALPDEPVLGLAATGEGDGLVLYASTATSGVHRSGDGGRNWEARADGLTVDGQRDEPEYADRPDFGPMAAAEAPEGPPVLFVGGFDGLFRSVDGAATWSEVETIPSTTVVGLALSPTFAEDRTLVATTYLNGVHISRDGGRTWEPSNDGLEERGQYDDGVDRFARLYGPAFSPGYASDGTLYVTRVRSIVRSTDRGSTWSPVDVPGTSRSDGALYYLITSPEPDVVLLVDVRNGRVHRSDDGGRTIGVGTEVGRSVLSLATDPLDPRVLHAGTPAGVISSVDGGATWGPAPSDQPWAVTSLAAVPGPGASVLLAGTPRGLRVSRDGGGTWAPADLGGTSDRPIEGVVASPATAAGDEVVLVSARGAGLFRSTDAGATFEPVAPALGPEQRIPTSYSKPTSAPIAFSPTFAEDRTVVASVGPEVLVSADGGETWTAHELDAATHPPVERRPADPASGWGRRRKVAVGAAAVLLVAGGAVGLALVARSRRRRDPGDPDDGAVPSAEVAG